MRRLINRVALLSGLALVSIPAAEPKPAPDPIAEYASRAGKLAGSRSAKSWLALADFCEDRGLVPQREEALRRILAFDAENPLAHARLDERKVGQGWLPADEADAKEIEEHQAKGQVFYGKEWIPPKEAEKRREADRKAMGWDLDFRMDTPHLFVYSTRPVAFTWKVAALLENEIEAYRKFYGEIWTPDPKMGPLKVFLFKDRESYLAEGKRGAHHDVSASAAFYLCIPTKAACRFLVGPASNGDDTEVLRYCAHEMVHAMDDLMSRLAILNAPLWVTEGRAEHFKFGQVGRQIIRAGTRAGSARRAVRETLEQGRKVGLSDLLSMDEKSFKDEQVWAHYARSWTLVHFLFHGANGRYAAGFRDYLKHLSDQPSKAAFEKAVGRLPEIERELDAYTEGVLLPALERE